MTTAIDEQTSQVVKSFPVIASAITVCRVVWERSLDFLLIAWLPLLVLALLNDGFLTGRLLDSWAYEGAWSDLVAQKAIVLVKHPSAFFWSFIVGGVVQFLFASMMAVAFIRYLLLGERRFGLAGTGLSYGPNVRRYFFWLLIFGLFYSIVVVCQIAIFARLVASFASGGTDGPVINLMIFSGLVGYIASVLSNAPLLLATLAAPLLFRFPAAAIGDRRSFVSMWRLSKGNRLRLAAFVVIICFGFSVLNLVVFGIVPRTTGLIPVLSEMWNATGMFL